MAIYKGIILSKNKIESFEINWKCKSCGNIHLEMLMRKGYNLERCEKCKNLNEFLCE